MSKYITSDEWDGTQAQGEGWDMFDVDGRFHLQRIDCPSDHEFLDYELPKFMSDVHAIIHVALLASMGSEYHFGALSLQGTLAE